MRLIDSEPLLDMLEREENENEDIPNRSDGIRDAIIDILNAPTIEAVPVAHGRWIQADLAKDCVVCSVCKNRGYKDRMAWRPDYAKRYFNFCPNCGAKMEGAEDAGRDE